MSFYLPTPFNFVVILCAVFVIGSLLGAISKHLRDFAIHREELQFKREMIDRGLSVDEIDQLSRLHGRPSRDDADRAD